MMKDLIIKLANLPNIVALFFTLLGGIGINVNIILHYFFKDGKKKIIKTLIAIMTIFSFVFVAIGEFAKTQIVIVPYVFGRPFFYAKQILEREGIIFECLTPPQDELADTVVYVSATEGSYILKDTVVVLKLKYKDTIEKLVVDSSEGDKHSVLSKDPTYYNNNTSSPDNGENELKSNIPISSFLKPTIGASLNGSTLTIKVDSKYGIFDNVSPNSVFEWGVELSSNLNNYKEGDVYLKVNIMIDNKYNILSSSIRAYEVRPDSCYLIDRLGNTVNTTFDGQYFNIVCDIENKYIPVNDICVYTVSYANI